MDEIRINCAHPSPEEAAMAKQQMQTLFRLNHTMPVTDEFDALVKELFPDMGEGSHISTPLSGVRFNKVKIGNKVIIMPSCLMMSAGGITINPARLIRCIK